MHSMNLFWAIMGYTEKHKDITEFNWVHGGVQAHAEVIPM
jgi:hypothetical protein